MEFLGLLGIAAFWLMSLVVGVRLVWLARATRRFPELAVGASFLFAGFAGLGLNLVAQHGELSPAATMWTSLAGAGIGDVGYGVLAAFVWRVFQSDTRAGRVGFALCVSGLAVGFAVQFALARPDPTRPVSLGFWITLCAQIAIYVWAAAESLSYWDAMRRRAQIGLAEPLVANRFLLWGVGMASIAGIWLHLGWTRLDAQTATMSSVDYLVIATLGFVCAVSCWVAFLQPRWYERRFARAEV